MITTYFVRAPQSCTIAYTCTFSSRFQRLRRSAKLAASYIRKALFLDSLLADAIAEQGAYTIVGG